MFDVFLYSTNLTNASIITLLSSWEPPEPSTHTVPELQELRNKIADIREDHIKRGLIRVDGRTM